MRYVKSIFSLMACPCTLRSKGEPIMDTVLSLLISAGIIAFGICVVAAGSLLGWTLMGIISVAVGLISLFSEIRKSAVGSPLGARRGGSAPG
jgi:hypothetical protein